jgi:DNA-binding HxlR family transcriptional regulator
LQYIKAQEESASKDEGLILLQIKFNEYPIKTSLGVLGKKWIMLIIRDIGFCKIELFNKLLESIPGLTLRVFSMRLKELEKVLLSHGKNHITHMMPPVCF